MEMTKEVFLIGCVFLFIIDDRRVLAGISLTPKNGNSVEKRPFTFNCSYNTSTTPQFIAWKIKQDQDNTNAYVTINGCSAIGFLSTTSYETSCGNGWVSVKINNVGLKNHGDVWFCYYDPHDVSNNVTLQVKVPVKTVNLSSNYADITENISATFNCTTSPCRPPPVVVWFLTDPKDNARENVTEKASAYLVNISDGLKSVYSTLRISFGRRKNAWKLYCVALNVDLAGNVTSKQKYLNILYPPNKIDVSATDGSNYTVVEKTEGQLSCSVHGGNPRSNITWICYNNIITMETKNATIYTSTISWIASRKQDRECFCLVKNPFRTSNKTINIIILYPPDRPTFSIRNVKVNRLISVIQNNSLQVTCESDSKPMPKYKWVNKTEDQNLHITQLKKQDAGKYTCKVTNEMLGTESQLYNGENISFITVNVLYQPSPPEFYFSSSQTYTNKSVSGGIINVIKGDKFSISCVSSANPIPTYRWDDGINTNTIEITAGKTLRKVCTAYNNMYETVGEKRNGTANGTLEVTVHYPPDAPSVCLRKEDCYFHDTSRSYKVVEDKPFNLTCKSKGNPNPFYKWYINGIEKSNSDLLTLTLKRNDKNTYICSAINTIIRTFGSNKTESRNTSISMDVLYPASIEKLLNETVLEGQSKNLTCRVRQGNPAEFRVSWSPPKGTYGSSEDNVYHLSNISRKNEGIYTCYVNTTMNPDIGRPESIIKTGNLYLNVEYKAVVIQFFGIQSENKHYTVDEHADAVLSCIIDSKPPPSVNISYNGGFLQRFNTNEVKFTKAQMQCTDSGRYKCTGFNKYNAKEPSSKTLQVFVKCSPRPSTNGPLIETIAVQKYSEAELNFEALAYPKPLFKWFFVNDSHMIFLQNDSNYLVLSSSLQTKLILTNVTESRYGQYILEIENTKDKFQQKFSIVHHDVPDAPVILSWVSTESEITLTIASAFNGGYTQQFLISYSEENEDKRNIIHINDEMPQTFNHTIHNVRSGLQYRIHIYAYNILGNSTEVSVIVETKGTTRTSQEGQNMTGLHIGIAFSVVTVIGISFGIVIFCYKKRNFKASRYKSSAQGVAIRQEVPMTNGSQVSHVYTDLDANKRDLNDYYTVHDQSARTYERLNIAGQISNNYMELNDTRALNTETSDYVNMRI